MFDTIKEIIEDAVKIEKEGIIRYCHICIWIYDHFTRSVRNL